jgi:hypothetical protein
MSGLLREEKGDFRFVIGEFKFEVQQVAALGFRPSGARCL